MNNEGESVRPKSALTYGFTKKQIKQFRLTDNQSLNSIRNSISKTFLGENKLWKEVQDLTTARIDGKYAQRIQRMCVQYSICPNPSRLKGFSEDIDIQFIAKKFVKSKSKDHKKEEDRQQLRQSVRKISRRYLKDQPQQFFKMDYHKLIQMQKKAKKANAYARPKRRQHPYLNLYEQSQNQVLAGLTEQNKISLGEASEYPALFEPDEWQRDHKKIKQIYSGINRMKYINSARGTRSRAVSGDDNYYNRQMLTQFNNSSKKLSKWKKERSKGEVGGFQFLMQSMERDKDKQNYLPNTLQQLRKSKQLGASLQFNPTMTMPVNSFKLTSNPPLTCNTAKFFLDNVKLLDHSDASISDPNNSNKSHYKGKNSEKSRGKNRRSSQQHSQISKFDGNGADLVYKVKQYLAVTEQLWGEDSASKKLKNKAKKIGEQLLGLLRRIEGGQQQRTQTASMLKSVNTTCFNLLPTDCGRQGGDYLRIISQLQNQKQKLNSLISQHEMANIKMFIKISEGESQQIQMCKTQLSLLFEKYKKLQGVIAKDNKRMIQLVKQKEQLSQKCKLLAQDNKDIRAVMLKYESFVEKLKEKERSRQQELKRQKDLQRERQRQRQNDRQARKKSDKKSINIFIGSGHNRNISYIQSQQHSRALSNLSIHERSHLSRSNLQIQQIQGSHNDSRLSEEFKLGCSSATATSRMKKKGGAMGVNLNALLESMSQMSGGKLAEDPQKLRKVILECKQQLKKMEGVIRDQNGQLEISVEAIAKYDREGKQKDQKIRKLEDRLAVRDREILLIQKERDTMKDYATSQKQKDKKKNLKDNRMNDCKFSARKGEKVKNHVQFDLRNERLDEYRIIAMQAQALQEIIHGKKFK